MTALDAPPAGAAPAPDGDALARAWRRPPGVIGWLSAVNHKAVAMRFMVTAFAFLLIGGVQALLIRTQLAQPDGAVLSPEAYNQAFTMHGTTMLFFFAVPMLEGIAMYVAPLMLGARDMPFPRLNAFGYWAYLGGGVLVYTSLFTGEVPDGGWFAYVPLTLEEFSPGRNMDFWLLGVTFVEISGIVGAIELITLVAKHRAPGMTLGRMPLFVWAVLAMAGTMLLAFPPLVAGSTLLELERAFDLPFFDPGRGGDPILWQHLFWIFGHPEVYIMLLPALGIVSTVVATAARRPVFAYPWVVASLLATGFVSFGLWVHHMFATGIPTMASAFFTVASLFIAIPSGIQIFAWISTLWMGRVRWTTPLLFVMGFVVIFVLGGITGVMVAVVPFDLQAHDSYFVVAHFHYVLIGGVVFPIFAALHHWWPLVTGRVLGDGLGKWTFWLMFVGFNVGFMPQHILGFLGMPRRVYTYDDSTGWAGLNLLSTVGGYILGLGILCFVANAVRSARGPRAAGGEALDPWEAGTLDWAVDATPPPPHNFTRLPVVDDLDPRWHPVAPAEGSPAAVLQEGLLRPTDGARETWSTSVLTAEPEEVVLIARPTLTPLLTTAGVVAALVGLLLDVGWLQLAGLLVAIVALVGWLWPAPEEAHVEPIEHERPLEPAAPSRRPGVTVGGVYGVGLGLVAFGAGCAALAFAAIYLVSQHDEWPVEGADRPVVWLPLVALALIVVAVAASIATSGAQWRDDRTRSIAGAAVTVAAGAAALVLLLVTLGRWPAAPTESVYGSTAAILLGPPALLAAVGVAMTLVVLERAWRSDDEHRPEIVARVARVWWIGTLAATALLGGLAHVLPYVR